MLNDILLLLIFSVASVAIFRRIDIPAVLGYLVVGLLAGDRAFGLIHDSHVIEQIAEIGVVFLLFTIGLEVSIPRLISMRNIVFGIGLVQVVVSTLSTIAIGMAFGLTWQSAFAVGGALAMSSTAIVTRLLSEQYELNQPHGNISLGVLLFQDLAVVPFLVLIPILARPGDESLVAPVGIALAKGALAFALIFYAGQHVLRPAVRRVAATHSSELFTLFILSTALLAAWLTWQLGLSLAMGAFLAGIMLAETEYQHHVENEIRPFRDVLMGLFFISVGSQFDWHIILGKPLEVAVLTLGLILGKGLAIGLITSMAGYSRAIAIRAGILLGQGSEFGFALLAVAIASGLIGLGPSQPIIAAIILSMAISPMLIRYNATLARRFAPDDATGSDTGIIALGEAGRRLRNHVLICGFGRTGQNLAQFLRRQGIPFIALEMETDIVDNARETGEPVFHANSSDPEVLRLAGLDHAQVIVISFTDHKSAELISRRVKEARPDIPLIVRTRDDRYLDYLLECGADEVIPDTIESSIMLARHTLTRLGQSPEEIEELLDQARAGRYARVRAYFHSARDIDPGKPDSHHLHSIEILGTYHAVGRRIDAMERLQQVRIIALHRNGINIEDPAADETIRAGDLLLIEGQPDEIHAAEIQVMSGL